MVYGQNHAQTFIANQQLRGPVLASRGVANEYKIRSDEVAATPEATGKVNLIILTESGCPDCQESIAGPLNGMITSPGFADILNVRQFR
jgi:hypothetical protein